MQIDTKQPRPRGRPRAYDAEAALGLARDAFWSAGYSATSLDDLSAATGMNRPSLYAAFGNKQSLYLKTLATIGQEMERQVSAVLLGPLPLHDALRKFYSKALDLYLSGEEGPRGCFVICTATAEAYAEPDVRRFLEGTLRGIDEAMVGRFRRALDAGEIGPDSEPESLGRIAASILHSLAVRSRAGQSRASLKRLIDGAVTLLAAPA